MATSKKKGIKSSAQDNFLAPLAPTLDSATDVGTNRAYDDGAVSVAFTANGPYAATSYTVLASTGQTATGSSSPIVVAGIATGATPTFTVKATNSAGDSPYSSASGAVTVTTVPATPSAPSASSPSAGTDSVSWSAPANGGKAITNYHWESNDSKSGDTGTATSVNVSQEQGTAQAYRVYATNANGNSAYSAYSGTVTTTFSFAPFSVFGFSPFSVFGFSPFSVFGFSPFGFSPFSVFGFSPFGFSPFGFSPFGFSPFGFFFLGCVDQDTLISVVGPNDTVAYKAAKDIVPGDEVWAARWTELLDESLANPNDMESAVLTGMEMVKTSIMASQPQVKPTTMWFNDDPSLRFSLEERMLVKRDGTYQFVSSGTIEVGDYVVKNLEDGTFQDLEITKVDIVDGDRVVYQFDAEPTDTIIAGNFVCHNAKAF
jgi:hypothetical protein